MRGHTDERYKSLSSLEGSGLLIVIDEHGEQWEVARGDPAWEVAMYLKALGFRNIMLPLSILITGAVSEAFPWPTIDQLQRLDGDAFVRYASLLDQANALMLQYKGG